MQPPVEHVESLFLHKRRLDMVTGRNLDPAISHRQLGAAALRV